MRALRGLVAWALVAACRQQGDSHREVNAVTVVALAYSDDGARLALMRTAGYEDGDTFRLECSESGIRIVDLRSLEVEEWGGDGALCLAASRSGLVDLSADWQTLAAGSDSGILVFGRGEGAPRRLGSTCVGSDGAPSWGPGGRLAFEQGCGDPDAEGLLAVTGLGDRQVRTLAKLPGIAYPAWSHSGRDIAASSSVVGVEWIVVVNSADGAVRTLTRGTLPSWRIDDRAIAFVRTLEGDEELAITGIAHDSVRSLVKLSELARLSGRSEKLFTGPARWRPDGRALAIATLESVWELDQSGNVLRRLDLSSIR